MTAAAAVAAAGPKRVLAKSKSTAGGNGLGANITVRGAQRVLMGGNSNSNGNANGGGSSSSGNGKPEQQQSRRKGYMQPTASSRSVVAGTGKPSSASTAGGAPKPKARKPALGDITNRKAGGSSSSMASVGAKLSKWEQKLQKQKHSVLGGVSGGAQRAVGMGMAGKPPKRTAVPQTTGAPRASFR